MSRILLALVLAGCAGSPPAPAPPPEPAVPTCEEVVPHMLALVYAEPEFQAASAEDQQATRESLEAQVPAAIDRCKQGPHQLDDAELRCMMAAKDVTAGERCHQPKGPTCEQVIDHMAKMALASPEFGKLSAEDQAKVREQFAAQRAESLAECEGLGPEMRECILAVETFDQLGRCQK